ncbi:MAG: response regulator transcription factor [Acidobacteriaceae bacterium]
MNKIILADNQAIFRAGAARVLALEEDMRIVAQCDDASRLLHAIESFSSTITLFASSLRLDIGEVLNQVSSAGGRAVLIAENGEHLDAEILLRLDGVVDRAISGSELVDCMRDVSRGKRCILRLGVLPESAVDSVGTRVRNRLTPREMQIVSLIVQGCKNKEIASRLGVTEQVVKNYLRSVYDKTGVSDRLELALFTIHHRILAEAAAEAGNLLQMASRQIA